MNSAYACECTCVYTVNQHGAAAVSPVHIQEGMVRASVTVFRPKNSHAPNSIIQSSSSKQNHW